MAGFEKSCIFAASKKADAQVAELVDASVSKTDEVTLVPVRSRPRVHEKIPDESQGFFVFFRRSRRPFFVCFFAVCGKLSPRNYYFDK